MPASASSNPWRAETSPLAWFPIAVLGVFRVAHLLAAEDGPWDLVVRLRRAMGNGALGRLFDCYYCLSLWTAIPFALAIGSGWRERLLLWPALSGGAVLVERMSDRARGVPPAPYIEGNPEDDDGMLRK